MELETGKIVEGKVTGIMPFGAFVTLEDGKTTGLVHISEIALDYVENIHDHLKMHDMVKVMIMSIDNNSKISLSIKRALKEERKNNPHRQEHRKPADIDWAPKTDLSALSFEDKMSKFKQDSEEKMQQFKRANDGKSRGRKFSSK